MMVLGNASPTRRVRRRSRRSGEESTSTRPVNRTTVSFPARSTSILRLLLEGIALVLYDSSAIKIHSCTFTLMRLHAAFHNHGGKKAAHWDLTFF
jgi:hypothetical protein